MQRIALKRICDQTRATECPLIHSTVVLYVCTVVCDIVLHTVGNALFCFHQMCNFGTDSLCVGLFRAMTAVPCDQINVILTLELKVQGELVPVAH